MERERIGRIADTAALVADLVVDCLGHAETAPLSGVTDERSREQLAESTKQRFMTAIAAKETDAHRRIITLHAHRHVRPDALPHALFDSGLFAETTWQLFGLGTRQLVGLATVAGGIAGAGIDAATLGHSFGLGAAVGAAAGGGGAWVLGKRRPELSIGWPGSALPGTLPKVAASWIGRRGVRLGGGDLVVGPFAAENFPWILLDRALCVFAAVYTRSHARRDETIVDVQSMLPRLDRAGVSVAHWPDADRRRCQTIFRDCRRGPGPAPGQQSALRDVIGTRLDRIVDVERSIGDGTSPR